MRHISYFPRELRRKEKIRRMAKHNSGNFIFVFLILLGRSLWKASNGHRENGGGAFKEIL
jgi:hypothetical protein